MISLLPFSARNADLILYLSLSTAGWFCKFGFLDDNRPVSVNKLRDEWHLECSSTATCKVRINVFTSVSIAFTSATLDRNLSNLLILS